MTGIVSKIGKLTPGPIKKGSCFMADFSDDIQHDMLVLALGQRLFTSKSVPETATILDVGTGKGTWACQVAQAFPRARVYGIDLHQVNPSKQPSNVIFETVDVMTGFPFNTGTFDFIHSRLLIGGITDWPSYLANLHRITKRGGKVECIEMELSPYSYGGERQNIDEWTVNMTKFLKQSDLDPEIATSLKSRMEDAGFCDVVEEVVEIPLGLWQESDASKQLGSVASSVHETYMILWMKESMVKSNIMDAKEAEEASSRMIRDLQNQELQAFWKWHFCSGTKAL